MASWRKLGDLIRTGREKKGLARDEVADKLAPFVDDADLRKLEGGGKLAPDAVSAVARFLGIAEKHWRPLLTTESGTRREFEDVLSELVGLSATLDHLDRSAAAAADKVLSALMKPTLPGASPPPVCRLGRNMTEQRPRFVRGKESRRGRCEEEASTVQHGREGRDPEAAHGGEGADFGLVQRAGDSAELVLLLAAAGAGEPGRSAEWWGWGGTEPPREGAGGRDHPAQGAPEQEGLGHRGDLG